MTKLKEVNQTVTDLIRVRYEAVYADCYDRTGEISGKLLLADTEERSNIFRKLFHTDIYKGDSGKIKIRGRWSGQGV